MLRTKNMTAGNKEADAAAGVFAVAQLVETDGAKHYNQGGEQTRKLSARINDKPLVG